MTGVVQLAAVGMTVIDPRGTQRKLMMALAYLSSFFLCYLSLVFLIVLKGDEEAYGVSAALTALSCGAAVAAPYIGRWPIFLRLSIVFCVIAVLAFVLLCIIRALSIEKGSSLLGPNVSAAQGFLAMSGLGTTATYLLCCGAIATWYFAANYMPKLGKTDREAMKNRKITDVGNAALDVVKVVRDLATDADVRRTEWDLLTVENFMAAGRDLLNLATFNKSEGAFKDEDVLHVKGLERIAARRDTLPSAAKTEAEIEQLKTDFETIYANIMRVKGEMAEDGQYFTPPSSPLLAEDEAVGAAHDGAPETEADVGEEPEDEAEHAAHDDGATKIEAEEVATPGSEQSGDFFETLQSPEGKGGKGKQT